MASTPTPPVLPPSCSLRSLRLPLALGATALGVGAAAAVGSVLWFALDRPGQYRVLFSSKVDLGDGDDERQAFIATIGPVWDGNEVWLVTGGGALFAAFPEVYATAFSGFYLAMLLVLLVLILRTVAQG